MEYYFDQLDPIKFQRLISAILEARFGVDIRLTPLRGQDGGRDGETAPGNPYYEFQIDETTSHSQGIVNPPRKGRYLFQVKHHRTSDRPSSEARQAVITDFRKELRDNIMKREGDERINYFFLVTNVPASKDAISKIDKIRGVVHEGIPYLHADVWWQESVAVSLDQLPSLWSSYPEIFAGGVPPSLTWITDANSKGMPLAMRLAISKHYEDDQNVKFRQIELEKNLVKLFVDLDINAQELQEEPRKKLLYIQEQLNNYRDNEESDNSEMGHGRRYREWRYREFVSALGVLTNENKDTIIRKIILEGGPGQGKSTITQMAIQMYRQQILGENEIDVNKGWLLPEKSRLPFRIELRRLAEWLNANPNNSIECYLRQMVSQDSGGNEITVNDIQMVVKRSPVILIFDGLDEIGNDTLRDDVLEKIMECISRFEDNLKADLRVIITTRPPALTGRGEILMNFERFQLAPMNEYRIEEYMNKWLSVQVSLPHERERIRESFVRRQNEPHVKALAQNPMQLSVLLQLIRLKGEAFPDRRAELYRDYFEIAIDRDVEKSPELYKNRDIIQALHEFIGYKVHALTEVNQADRTLEYERLLDMTKEWLKLQGKSPEMAQQFFGLGEERFGLIVPSQGEGTKARYGYAIQPIQEYFAAAFISNQITSSSAHTVFEAMIHRSYWKEVALFLAGLRRPNEKADLIARADHVDQDEQWYWYLDGRDIILQLLLEGVFSEPQYVFTLALDFIFELLDTKRIRVQREPANFLDSLNSILTDKPVSEHHQKYILGLLNDYTYCEDQHLMMRLFYVANLLLPLNTYYKAIMSYQGTTPNLIALIRLGWPYRWNVDIQKITQESSFWDGVSSQTWAQVLWAETIRNGESLDIQIPISIHQYLVEQFTLCPSRDYRQGSFFQQPFFETTSKLAIWKIYQYLQIHLISKELNRVDEVSRKTLKEKITCAIKTEIDVDYGGLDESTQIMIKDIIHLSRTFISASLGDNEEEKSITLNNYVEGIRKYLTHVGLVSWIAYRLAITLIEKEIRWRDTPLDETDPLFHLIIDVHSLCEDQSAGNQSNSSLVSLNFDFIRDIFLLKGLYPRYIRLDSGNESVAWVDLLVNYIRYGKELPFEWIKSIYIPREFLQHIIEECKDCLLHLFSVLSEFHFLGYGEAVLRVQSTQRMLKIARNTNNQKILAGIVNCLAGENFLRIAELDLILKLLRADSRALLAPYLFYDYKDRTEGKSADSFNKEIKIINEVAKRIVDNPEGYPLKTVCLAADFLAENNRIDLPPLAYEEERLKIEIRPAGSMNIPL